MKSKRNGNVDLVSLPWQKRMLDVFVSLLVIICLSPFYLLIVLSLFGEMLLSKRARGPLFYTELRVSRGIAFPFTKFRIFTVCAIENARKDHGDCIRTKWLEQKRENMTFVGNILNNIYMDEAPQLFHVLFGQMSLVGPRPTNVARTQEIRDAGNMTRDVIVGGLTGPYQSRKGESGADQTALDKEYVEFVRTASGWSVLFDDLKTLSRTIRVLVKAKGI